MYRTVKPNSTTINVPKVEIGETIEEKVRRIVLNGEPISDGAPIIHTEKAHGVMPEYNPRTDKWDVAIDAMDKVAAMNYAKSDNVVQMPKNEKGKNDGDAEPAQGTSKTD